jgi:hypothetical protein
MAKKQACTCIAACSNKLHDMSDIVTHGVTTRRCLHHTALQQ